MIPAILRAGVPTIIVYGIKVPTGDTLGSLVASKSGIVITRYSDEVLIKNSAQSVYVK